MLYTKKFTGPRCPGCKAKMHHPDIDLLLRHVHIAHARDVSRSDYEALTATGGAKYLKTLPTVSAFTLYRKRAIIKRTVGWCCMCMREYPQLWTYKDSSSSTVSLCAACREELLKGQAGDVFASGRLLPGSYGSGRG